MRGELSRDGVEQGRRKVEGRRQSAVSASPLRTARATGTGLGVSAVRGSGSAAAAAAAGGKRAAGGRRAAGERAPLPGALVGVKLERVVLVPAVP